MGVKEKSLKTGGLVSSRLCGHTRAPTTQILTTGLVFRPRLFYPQDTTLHGNQEKDP